MAAPSVEHLIALLFSTGRMLREKGGMDDGKQTVSHLHLATLRYVSLEKKPLMRDIATFLCITPPSATSLVHGLVKAGHLERVSNPEDRRHVRLALTPLGKKALTSGMKKKEELMKQVLSVLNDEEREQFAHILEKLAQ